MEWDRQYQVGLLLRAAMDKGLKQLLQPHLFDLDLQPIAKKVMRIRVSRGQLRQLAKKKGVDLNGEEELGNKDFDRQQIIEFLQVRSVRAAMTRAHEWLDDGHADRAVKEINKSHLKICTNGDSLNDMLSGKIDDWDRRNQVATGIAKLDQILEGGPAAGDVAGVIAGTNKGKTSLMVGMAAHAVMQGKRVMFVTLEQPEYQIRLKFARCFTENREIKKTSRKLLDIRKKLHKKGARCWIEEVLPYSQNMGMLNTKLPENLDVLFVDYADYMLSPNGTVASDHTGLGEIWVDMKRVAMEREIPVWTASQANRVGYDAQLVDTVHMAKSIDKGCVADQLLSINWNDVPDHSGEVVGTLYLTKNRHGEARHEIDVTMNFGTCRFNSVG